MFLGFKYKMLVFVFVVGRMLYPFRCLMKTVVAVCWRKLCGFGHKPAGVLCKMLVCGVLNTIAVFNGKY